MGGPVQAPVVVVVGADIQAAARREPVGSLGRRILHLAPKRVGTRRGGRVFGGARGVEHFVQHRDPVGDPVVGDASGERRVPGEFAQHAARAHAVVDVVGGEGRGVDAETEEGVLEIQEHVVVAEIAPQKARRYVPPAGLVPRFQRSAAGRIVDGVGEIDEPVPRAGPQGGRIHLVDARLGHLPAAEQDVPWGAAVQLHAPLEVAALGHELEGGPGGHARIEELRGSGRKQGQPGGPRVFVRGARPVGPEAEVVRQPVGAQAELHPAVDSPRQVEEHVVATQVLGEGVEIKPIAAAAEVESPGDSVGQVAVLHQFGRVAGILGRSDSFDGDAPGKAEPVGGRAGDRREGKEQETEGGFHIGLP